MEEKSVDIEELFYCIKKRRKILISITVVITVISVIYAFFINKPNYTATSKIFIGKNESVIGNYSKEDIDSYASLMNTYTQLIKTNDFMDEVIKIAKVEIESSELLKNVDFISEQDSPILKIKYTSEDITTAKKIVNIITSEFQKEVTETILNVHTKVIERTRVITDETSKISIILIGLMAGFVLALGVIFIINYLDNTIRNKEELEKIIDIPVLGELPLDKDLIKERGEIDD